MTISTLPATPSGHLPGLVGFAVTAVIVLVTVAVVLVQNHKNGR